MIRQLTGIRIIAALWVLGYHYKNHFGETLAAPSWLADIFAHGYLAVDLFFVLSGFILTHKYADTPINRFDLSAYKNFLAKRLARIYPVHVACLAGMAALVTVSATGGLDPDRYNASGFLMDISLTRTFFGASQGWNTPAWSLSAEWFAYILFPAVVWLVSRTWARGRAAIICLIVLLLGVQALAATAAPSINTMPTPAVRVLTAFTLGSLMHFATQGRRQSRAAPWGAYLAFGALPILPSMINAAGLRAAVGVGVATAVIYTTAVGGGMVARVLASKPYIVRRLHGPHPPADGFFPSIYAPKTRWSIADELGVSRVLASCDRPDRRDSRLPPDREAGAASIT
jgi:peptidoglycan/LPS O-acetylase OafA/YrhL